MELTPKKRARIVQMREDGASLREVSERFETTMATVSRTVKKFNEHHTFFDLERSGRPSIVDDRMRRRVIRFLKLNKKMKFGDVAEAFEGLTESTVRTIAHDAGRYRRVARRKPFLTKLQMEKRLAWAQNNRDTDWASVIFTDEAHLVTGRQNGRIWVTRSPNEVNNLDCLEPTFRSDRKSIMVWGCVALGRKGPLFRIPLQPSTSNGKVRTKAEGLNGTRYVEHILSGPLLQSLREWEKDGRKMRVVEDGAPCHKSAPARNFREENSIERQDHPPNSPDLNPIENVWDRLNGEIKRIGGHLTSTEALERVAQAAWLNIPQDFIDGKILEMKQRVIDVQASKGAHTIY